MPDRLEGLRQLLWSHGFQFLDIGYELVARRAGALGPDRIELTVTTPTHQGEFEFWEYDNEARMAASILQAFNPNHCGPADVYGLVSMSEHNPPGAAYDFGADGAMVDRSSLVMGINNRVLGFTRPINSSPKIEKPARPSAWDLLTQPFI